MTTEVATQEAKPPQVAIQTDNNFQVFAGASAFESAQRMAKALASSTLVPKEYQGNLSNCLIALEIGMRSKASPLMVMQNLAVIHGRPSWSSQFIISAINTSGKFSPLRFRITEEESERIVDYVEFVWDDTSRKNKPVQKTQKIRNRTCVAYAVEKDSGEVLESPPVSLEIAVKEGWYNKSGSKWQTMPDLMLRYRAAAFFGRLYAPEILMGMKAAEEIIDAIDPIDIPPPKSDLLNEKYLGDVTEKTENVTSVEVKAEPKLEANEPVNHPKKTKQDDSQDEIPSWVVEMPPENSVVGSAATVQAECKSEMNVSLPASKAANPPKVSVPVVNGLSDWEGWVALLQEKELPQVKTKRDAALFRKKYETQIGNLAKADNALYFQLEGKLQGIANG